MNDKKKCFVIMPFSETESLAEEKWTEIFEHIIKPAVEESELNYECKRYGLGRANIIKDILEDLNRAQEVIADLTDNNPNVLWELGVRHVLKRRTILISQDKKFLPSDLKDYPVIPYDQTKAGFDKFKEDIKDKLKDIEADPEKPDSPVADFLELKNIYISSYEKSANLRKLDALISELSYAMDSANTIHTVVKQNEQARKEGKAVELLFPSKRLANTCLELLLSTSYIVLPQELLKSVRGLSESIELLNISLELWTNPRFEKEVEKKLKQALPNFEKVLVNLLGIMNKVRTDYANDNYQEPKEPIILLASPEHEKYLKLLE